MHVNKSTEGRHDDAVGVVAQAATPQGNTPPRSGGLSLVTESNNHTDPDPTEPFSGFVPVYEGGRFDPVHGPSLSFQDHQRVKALVLSMKHALFMTFTLNRDRWTRDLIRERWRGLSDSARKKSGLTDDDIESLPVEELAYRFQAQYVPRLLRRLGFKLWVRVIEPQTSSGDGWMHWHVIAEALGTPWCHGGWVDFKTLNPEVWRIWRDDFGGGRPDVQLVKSRQRVSSYLWEYVGKKWPAIPPWVLNSERGLRRVGFSRAARQRVRELLNEPAAKPTPEPTEELTEQEGQDKPKRKRGERVTLLTRLARSGLRSSLIVMGRFVGIVNVPRDLLLTLTPLIAGLERVEREYPRRDGTTVKRLGVTLSAWQRAMFGGLQHRSRHVVCSVFEALRDRIMAQVDRLELGKQFEQTWLQRLDDLLHGWERMQSLAESA